MAVKDRTLQTVLGELKALQDEFKGKPMPEEKAAEFERLAAEAKGMQDEVDRGRRLEEMERKGREFPGATLPPEDRAGEEKGQEVAGYMTLGDFVASGERLKAFNAAGQPKAPWPLAEVKSLMAPRRGGPVLVPLTRAMRQEIKAVPTLGPGVIEPTRLDELVRVTEHDRLRLRDVLNLSQTGADAVLYTRLVSYTRAAAPTAAGVAKPEATLSMDTVTEAVRTIPVWIPVHNQQLADYPALAGIINGELLYDVMRTLEELVMYGSGAGEEFNGLLVDSDVGACRTEVGDTLIDIARRGITDVTVAGYEPNAILVHPRDWESIVLEKGSDNRYVWVVVTEAGVSRLWGIPVVETVAVEASDGDATEERNLVVGDFRRGATLWERMAAQISVGWINDQFIKNQRTILAEGRWAFGVTRPGAFRRHITQAAVAS